MFLARLQGKLVALILILSALAVIYNSFVNRHLAHEWQALGNSHTQLQEEYGRLMLEYSTLAAPSRIEVLARDELNMIFPDKNNTRIIELNEQ